MFDHPQVLAEGMIGTFAHPLVGRYRGLLSAYKFGDGPAEQGGEADDEDGDRAAPVLGQHTDKVLGCAGYSAAEIASLRALGAIA
jgi:crotonobetainyl-CoA:carnitine CoA-transferase CaiB-like acyl-CoA transferase